MTPKNAFFLGYAFCYTHMGYDNEIVVEREKYLLNDPDQLIAKLQAVTLQSC